MNTSNQKIQNRSMPDCSILPVLAYKDTDEAIEWLCKTFGFAERWRIPGHRAQLAFENGAMVVTQSMANNQGRVMMRVSDVDAHYENAVKHGARIISKPESFPYGERQYAAEDLNGHYWTFSQSIKDVAPEEWGAVSGMI